jgi:hypothetical protein
MNADDKDNFVRPESAWNRYPDHFTLTKPNTKDYISIFLRERLHLNWNSGVVAGIWIKTQIII